MNIVLIHLASDQTSAMTFHVNVGELLKYLVLQQWRFVNKKIPWLYLNTKSFFFIISHGCVNDTVDI